MVALDVVTAPVFYVFAVPAALLIGLAKSGFAAGIGSLTVPLLAMACPIPDAVAITLPLLAVADAVGVAALRRGADWRLLRVLLPAGLAGILLGWAGFGVLDAHVVAGIVGAATLAFLLLQLVRPPRAGRPPPGTAATAALALGSGFVSFVAHAGGPPIAVALIPRRMAPVAFAGTSAVFFATINAAKWVPYAALGLLSARNMATSLVLMPVAAFGVLLGAFLARRISNTWFYRLVQVGMLLSGAKLLSEAFV